MAGAAKVSAMTRRKQRAQRAGGGYEVINKSGTQEGVEDEGRTSTQEVVVAVAKQRSTRQRLQKLAAESAALMDGLDNSDIDLDEDEDEDESSRRTSSSTTWPMRGRGSPPVFPWVMSTPITSLRIDPGSPTLVT